MALSRRLRRWLSGALAMTVLFTQLAVAAYACPPTEHPAHTAPAAMVGMPDCHGAEEDQSDAAQPQLCKAHCTNEAQSAARAISPDLQPNPASVALLQRVIEPVTTILLPIPLERAAPLAGPPDPLPLYLSLHVLRN